VELYESNGVGAKFLSQSLNDAINLGVGIASFIVLANYGSLHSRSFLRNQNKDNGHCNVTEAKVRRLPTFVGIGPTRTGTTWLHAAFQGCVGLPRRTKETDYFSNNYSLGFSWYLSHFRSYPSAMVLGEFTPTYFDYQDSPARIAQDLPDCKIVCTLRDPVDRIYSHYRLLRSEGWIGRQTLFEALEHHSRWRDGAGNMLGTNRYAFHLSRWFREFGRENVLVAFVEDLKTNPQQYLNDIADFIRAPRVDLQTTGIANKQLNLNPSQRAPLHPHLASRARRLRDSLERKRFYRTLEFLQPFFRYCYGRGTLFSPLDPETEQVLRERFRPEVDALEDLLGREISQWRVTAK